MTDNLLKDIGMRIRAVRKELNLSQKDFAAKLGLSACSLSEIETGKAKPGPPFFHRLSCEYRVSISHLFYGTGSVYLRGECGDAPGEREDVEQIEEVEDLIWVMEHSRLFRDHIMGYASRFYLEHEAVIKKNIEYSRKKKGALKKL